MLIAAGGASGAHGMRQQAIADTMPEGEAEDESDIVFDTSVLHEIRIEVDPEHLDDLEDDHTRRVPCTFTFDGITLHDVGIRQKGQGSQLGSLYDKPSFSIKFNEFEKGQKLHGLAKLLLNNAEDDATLLGEHIGYDTYRRAGQISRRTAHAVVTFVGLDSGEQNYGVHVIVEAINKAYLKRHFGDGNHDGNLYEEDTGDFASDPYNMILKDPDEDGHSYQPLIELADFVREADADDEDLIEDLEELIDVDAFIMSFAIDLVTQHGDGLWLSIHNYYLYQNPADDRFHHIPHGMDLLLESEDGECGVVPDRSEVAARLGDLFVDNEELRGRMYDAVDYILDTVWDVDYIEDRIDTLTYLLADADHDGLFLADRYKHMIALDTLKQVVRGTAGMWRNDDEAVCGDGIRSGRELCFTRCDDGNDDDDDGCSSECEAEDGYYDFHKCEYDPDSDDEDDDESTLCCGC